MHKARQYYQRLYHARHGQSGPARLEQVAEQLCCSPRHARAVLATLAGHGWLQWQAGRGRGQLSQLHFHTHPATLEADALQQHLARGDIESAMQQLTPASRQRLGELLPAYLGVQPGSEQRLRIPFYRPLHSLDPVQINRRTECHLIRQLFDGLTCYQRDSGRIEPALAHHWQHDTSLQQWRFVLRPGVLFHHGRPLEGEDVRQTLYRLRDEPGPFQRLFAHVQSVQLPAPREVQITLSQPDALLPHRLADHCAVILPRERWPQADFGRLPSGTGPFRLSINNAHRATLRAFERYWQARPLLDEVDIWVVNDDATRARLDVRLGYHGATPPQGQYTLQAEPGCSYVCANPATLDASQRAALAAWLHPAQWPADLGRPTCAGHAGAMATLAGAAGGSATGAAATLAAGHLQAGHPHRAGRARVCPSGRRRLPGHAAGAGFPRVCGQPLAPQRRPDADRRGAGRRPRLQLLPMAGRRIRLSPLAQRRHPPRAAHVG